MKGIIFYHSNSGNTKLVCEYLKRKIDSIEFDLHDIIEKPLTGIYHYDIVGFATWTFFLDIPPLFRKFILDVPHQQNKPAFLLNTFGIMPGRSLKTITNILSQKGMLIFNAHSLHTPESYPPYIIKGWDSKIFPNDKEMEQFNAFIKRLNTSIELIRNQRLPDKAKIKIGLLNSIIKPYSIEKARHKIGKLSVNETLCTKCGKCLEACKYDSIVLNPAPVFNMQLCIGCWNCFNHCEQKAIYTEKIRGIAHYPEPAEEFLIKLCK